MRALKGQRHKGREIIKTTRNFIFLFLGQILFGLREIRVGHVKNGGNKKNIQNFSQKNLRKRHLDIPKKDTQATYVKMVISRLSEKWARCC
jgi:hypothetical protein